MTGLNESMDGQWKDAARFPLSAHRLDGRPLRALPQPLGERCAFPTTPTTLSTTR